MYIPAKGLKIYVQTNHQDDGIYPTKLNSISLLPVGPLYHVIVVPSRSN